MFIPQLIMQSMHLTNDGIESLNFLLCCLHFHQVFYLDSINLGEISMAHDVFPRIKVFTADKIRAMINADKRPVESTC
jgi:hypothetical protein